MQRPSHLTDENAGRFSAPSVADAYPCRLPYSPKVFDVLQGLVRDPPGAVLDLGTGTGDIARRLATSVDRVDAVDMSAAMIEKGRSLPGGQASNLNWIVGRAEDAALTPPYALVTAGESLHWMAWEVLLPRLAQVLTPNGVLAIVDRNELQPPWHDGLMAVVRSFSAIRNYEVYNLIEELERRQLFKFVDTVTTPTESLEQTVDEYICSFHSRASLSRDAIGPERARAFCEEVRRLVEPWVTAGRLRLELACRVTWGHPL